MATPALADWTPLGVENYIFTAYVDRDSIHRQDGKVRMAGMYDFKKQDFTPEGQGLYSTVVLREYDCGASQVRLLSYIDFVGHKGEGGAVSQVQGAGRWEAVAEGGVDDAYWRAACGR
ncbi:MAG: surface-adhesin E family protein [Burkholderiales bacterium]